MNPRKFFKLSQLGIFLILLLFLGPPNCGGSDTCDFNISSFLNGSNYDSSTTFWSCIQQGSTLNVAIYSNGTGLSEEFGAFTWEEAGCGRISYTSSEGDGVMSNIEGSISSGVVTLTNSSGEASASISCTLQKITQEEDLYGDVYLGNFDANKGSYPPACMSEFPSPIRVTITDAFISSNDGLYTKDTSVIEIEDPLQDLLIVGQWVSSVGRDFTFDYDGWECLGEFSAYLKIKVNCLKDESSCDFDYI